MGYALEKQDVWTPQMVEDRLVHALDVYRRLPDRERGWLNASIMSIWRQRIRERQVDYPPEVDTSRPIMTAQASRDQLREADEALGWCDRWLNAHERKLVSLALLQVAAGYTNIRWDVVRRMAGWTKSLTTDTMRKQYSRALSKIATRL